jgi:hypothetical protein
VGDGRERLPRSVELPSRRVVELDGRYETERPRREPGAPLFADALRLFERGVVKLQGPDGQPVRVRGLALADFHALRAIVTRLGWLYEDEVTLSCQNCDRVLLVRPCSALELGPFVDRELDDAELDRTLDVGVPRVVPAIRVGKEKALTVTFGPLVVKDAVPLFAALARRRLRVDEELVSAMGVVGLGAERAPAPIARALARCSGAAWTAVTRLYLETHYPPRLFSVTKCPGCGARNDADAPYEREFLLTAPASEAKPKERGLQSTESVAPQRPSRESDERTGRRTKRQPFPSFDEFSERARQLKDDLSQAASLDDVILLVDGDVPACDEGGVPLLGSYAPAFAGDVAAPTRQAEIAVYYRTFRAMWKEEGPFDWEEELKETIVHEAEHHRANLYGFDPVDEAEQHEIEIEAAKLVGKRAILRGVVRSFGTDLGSFLRKTWLIWLTLIAVCLLAAIANR